MSREFQNQLIEVIKSNLIQLIGKKEQALLSNISTHWIFICFNFKCVCVCVCVDKIQRQLTRKVMMYVKRNIHILVRSMKHILLIFTIVWGIF